MQVFRFINKNNQRWFQCTQSTMISFGHFSVFSLYQLWLEKQMPNKWRIFSNKQFMEARGGAHCFEENTFKPCAMTSVWNNILLKSSLNLSNCSLGSRVLYRIIEVDPKSIDTFSKMSKCVKRYYWYLMFAMVSCPRHMVLHMRTVIARPRGCCKLCSSSFRLNEKIEQSNVHE